MNRLRWTAALLIVQLCGSAYAGTAQFGTDDDDPPSPPAAARPATPDASKSASPSIEQTIDFVQRILPQAASNEKIPYIRNDYEFTIGVNVTTYILPIKDRPNDFAVHVTAHWADNAHPDYWDFNLSEVSLSEGKSKELLKADRRTALNGLLIE